MSDKLISWSNPWRGFDLNRSLVFGAKLLALVQILEPIVVVVQDLSFMLSGTLEIVYKYEKYWSIHESAMIGYLIWL